MKDVRSSRVAIRGPHVWEFNHSAASFHDGFVQGRKWFRPPHWNAVRGELIQVCLGRRALAAQGRLMN